MTLQQRLARYDAAMKPFTDEYEQAKETIAADYKAGLARHNRSLAQAERDLIHDVGAHERAPG